MIKWTKKDVVKKISEVMQEPIPGEPTPPNELATRKLLNLPLKPGQVR